MSTSPTVSRMPPQRPGVRAVAGSRHRGEARRRSPRPTLHGHVDSTRPAPARRSSSMPCRRFSAVLGPNPRRSFSRPRAMRAPAPPPRRCRAPVQHHRLLRARAWGSRSAPAPRRAPAPAAPPPPRSARVGEYSTIFSAIESPTFGIAAGRPGRARRRRRGAPPTARAAFSYTRTLNASPPVIASRSAYSCSSAATASLGRAMTPVYGPTSR